MANLRKLSIECFRFRFCSNRSPFVLFVCSSSAHGFPVVRRPTGVPVPVQSPVERRAIAAHGRPTVPGEGGQHSPATHGCLQQFHHLPSLMRENHQFAQNRHAGKGWQGEERTSGRMAMDDSSHLFTGLRRWCWCRDHCILAPIQVFALTFSRFCFGHLMTETPGYQLRRGLMILCPAYGKWLKVGTASFTQHETNGFNYSELQY